MKNKNKLDSTKDSKSKKSLHPLLKHSKKELELAGLLNSDSEFDKRVAKDTLQLIKLFIKQRHSGCSAEEVLRIFNKLVKFENLTPLTDNSNEWEQIIKPYYTIWQSKRNPYCFSHDGGKTFYNINEVQTIKTRCEKNEK